MKQTIKLTESELRSIVNEIINEIKDTNYVNENIDEGLIGMAAGAILDNIVIQKVVDLLANILHLDRNGVLYRVLSSRLFAMSLGNEIQNSIKLKKQAAQQNGGMPSLRQSSSTPDIVRALQAVKGGNEQAIPILLGMRSR